MAWSAFRLSGHGTDRPSSGDPCLQVSPEKTGHPAGRSGAQQPPAGRPPARFVCVVACDARTKAASQLVGGEAAFTSDEFCAVKTGGTWLATVRVADFQPPTWPDPAVPKQMHLDLAVDDLDAAEAEAIRLGHARRTTSQPPTAGESYLILRATPSACRARFRNSAAPATPRPTRGRCGHAMSIAFWLSGVFGSGDEDLMPVPVEVFAGGGVGAWWQDQRLAQWRVPVVLPGQRVGPDGVGQRAGEWMRSPPLTVSRPVSKATSWAGQAARPLRGSRRSPGCCPSMA